MRETTRELGRELKEIERGGPVRSEGVVCEYTMGARLKADCIDRRFGLDELPVFGRWLAFKTGEPELLELGLMGVGEPGSVVVMMVGTPLAGRSSDFADF